MKSITVLRFLIIIFSLLIIKNPLLAQVFGENRNYGFSIGPQFGFVNGQALEYVYPTNTKAEYLSELRWDMKPVLYYGFEVGFSRLDPFKKPGFFLNASFNWGIPGESGIHENRDWMSIENSHLTHFSSHTNVTNDFYWFDGSLGFSIPVNSIFALRLFFGGSRMHFAFTGKDGYGIYARRDTSNPGTYHPIDDDPLEYDYSGMEVIRYKQDWLNFFPGIGISTKITERILFDVSLQMSILTYCYAIDEHLTTGVTYYDSTRWGFYLQPGAYITLKATNWLVFTFDFSYSYITPTRGETVKKENNFYVNVPNRSGAGLSVYNLKLISRIIF